ncbi:uncharacterized protein BDZ99DRAFT_483440 [Mytilinidion resinicola]|uniref:SAP domain-containing protein n=1 Tax=Mytilinidion resinicola TaxID=574789 RepID=A0A6A6XYK7_9PEZI|nr:uncharacterized protein BDZ99DRAFT_483440 [Mytilinidion resinicola]KAF2801646.1 hypothetical protein BDZ99DRAFT_483440 [Mytilinidion resinicola]
MALLFPPWSRYSLAFLEVEPSTWSPEERNTYERLLACAPDDYLFPLREKGFQPTNDVNTFGGGETLAIQAQGPMQFDQSALNNRNPLANHPSIDRVFINPELSPEALDLQSIDWTTRPGVFFPGTDGMQSSGTQPYFNLPQLYRGVPPAPTTMHTEAQHTSTPNGPRASPVPYAYMRVPELRKELKKREIHCTTKMVKAHLIEQLVKADLMEEQAKEGAIAYRR